MALEPLPLDPPPNPNRVRFPYQGTVIVQGIRVLVETAAGNAREGTGHDGVPWRVIMPWHYGEIRNTVGVDGDKLDAFVGPLPDAPRVYIIRQKVPGTPDFDEDKVMLGFGSRKRAERAYRAAYNGRGFWQETVTMPVAEFHRWLADRTNRGTAVVREAGGSVPVVQRPVVKASERGSTMEILRGRVVVKATRPQGPPTAETCPACGQVAEGRCRCRMGERFCPHGHRWAVCPPHGHTVVTEAGEGFHGRGEGHKGCICHLGRVILAPPKVQAPPVQQPAQGQPLSKAEGVSQPPSDDGGPGSRPPAGSGWPPRGPGWEPIPRGKHGGYRRPLPSGGFEYRYPDGSGGGRPGAAPEEEGAPRSAGEDQPAQAAQAQRRMLPQVRFADLFLGATDQDVFDLGQAAREARDELSSGEHPFEQAAVDYLWSPDEAVTPHDEPTAPEPPVEEGEEKTEPAAAPGERISAAVSSRLEEMETARRGLTRLLIQNPARGGDGYAKQQQHQRALKGVLDQLAGHLEPGMGQALQALVDEQIRTGQRDTLFGKPVSEANQRHIDSLEEDIGKILAPVAGRMQALEPTRPLPPPVSPADELGDLVASTKGLAPTLPLAPVPSIELPSGLKISPPTLVHEREPSAETLEAKAPTPDYDHPEPFPPATAVQVDDAVMSASGDARENQLPECHDGDPESVEQPLPPEPDKPREEEPDATPMTALHHSMGVDYSLLNTREALAAHFRSLAPFGGRAGWGEVTRGKKNQEALALSERLAREKRDPSPEERGVLAGYTGRGGIGESINEFYTPVGVVSAMWASLAPHLKEQPSVLEPSCGPGAFLEHAPLGCRVTGVEFEKESSQVARQLHPQHEVMHGPFERFAILDTRRFDAVVGNPPFGERGRPGQLDPDKRWMTGEQYGPDTALDKARDGAIVMMVLPSSVIDSQDQTFRSRLLEKAEVVGAHRLPSNTFKHGHASVTTDILILRKRPQSYANVAGALLGKERMALDDHNEFLRGGESFWENPEKDAKERAGGYHWRSPDVKGKVHGKQEEGFGGRVTVTGELDEGALADLSLAMRQEIATALGKEQKTGKQLLDSYHFSKKSAQKRKEELEPLLDDVPYTEAEGTRKLVEGVQYICRRGDKGQLEWKNMDDVADAAAADSPSNAAIAEAREIGKAILDLQRRTRDGQETMAELNHTREQIVQRALAWTASSGKPGKYRRLIDQIGDRKAAEAFAAAIGRDGELCDFLRCQIAPPPASPTEDPPANLEEAVLQSARMGSGTVQPAQVAQMMGTGDSAEVHDFLLRHPAYHLEADGRWVDTPEYLHGHLAEKRSALERQLAVVKAAREHARGAKAWINSALDQAGAADGGASAQDEEGRYFLRKLSTIDDLDAVHAKLEQQKSLLEEHLAAVPLDDLDFDVRSGWLPREIVDSFLRERMGTKYGAVHDGSQWSLTLNGREMSDKQLGHKDHEALKPLERYLNRRPMGESMRESMKGINISFRNWLVNHPTLRDVAENEYNSKVNNYRPKTYSTDPVDLGPNWDHGVYETDPKTGKKRWVSGGRTPHGYQHQVARSCIEDTRKIIADNVGLGKAQPVDSLVLTPVGWLRLGDLEVGDPIIDPDGGVGQVTAVYERGERDCFRVTTKDGASAYCCDEHLWGVYSANDRAKGGSLRVMQLKDLRGDLKRPTGASKWFLPLPESVQLQSLGALPLDPYLLGVVIGNGGLSGGVARLSSRESWIVDRVRRSLPAGVSLALPQGSAPGDWHMTCGQAGPGHNPLINALRSLGLFGLRSVEKFIPQAYLYAGPEDRLELLRGLMDTDGDAVVGGTCIYSTSSRRLADDVMDLARSLGGIASLSCREEPKYTYKGEVRIGQSAYRVNVRLPVNPFSLPRKAERWHKPYMARAIESVEPCGRAQMRCIMTDTRRHLYVTDGWMVTHNTTEMIALSSALAHRGEVKRIVKCVPKAVLWNWEKEIKEVRPDAKILVIGEKKVTDRKGNVKTTADGELRAQKWHQMVQGNYDFVVCSIEAMQDVPLPLEYKKQFLEEEFVRKHGKRVAELSAKSVDPKDKSRAKRAAAKVAKLRAKFLAAYESAEKVRVEKGMPTFDELGIDCLFFDEAHNYKNLFIPAGREGEPVKYLGTGAVSQRALDMQMKTRRFLELNNNQHLYLATATPVKNTPLEVYTMLSYIAPKELEDMGIHNHEEFIDRYAKIEPKEGVTPQGEFKMFPTLTGFKNVRELRRLLDRMVIHRNAKDVGLPIPEGNPILVTGDMHEDQAALYKVIQEHYAAALEEMKAGGFGGGGGGGPRPAAADGEEGGEYSAEDEGPDESDQEPVAEDESRATVSGMMDALAEGEDAGTNHNHILALLHQMNLAALDPSLCRPDLLEEAGVRNTHSPKLAKVVDTLAQSYQTNPEGGQVVFCDINAIHGKVRQALIDRGVPPEAIGVINRSEVKSSGEQLAMSQDFNDPKGKLRIVIGNTRVMGEGVNLQKRATALHHIDIPWDPGTKEQRDGRAIRQGNPNDTVDNYHYAMKGTMDGYRYSLLKGKGDWMHHLWNGTSDEVNIPTDSLGMSSDQAMVLAAADPEAAAAALEEKRRAGRADLAAKEAASAHRMFGAYAQKVRNLDRLKAEKNPDQVKIRSQQSAADNLRNSLTVNDYFKHKEALDLAGQAVFHQNDPTKFVYPGLVIKQGDKFLQVVSTDPKQGTAMVVDPMTKRSSTIHMVRQEYQGPSVFQMTEHKATDTDGMLIETLDDPGKWQSQFDLESNVMALDPSIREKHADKLLELARKHASSGGRWSRGDALGLARGADGQDKAVTYTPENSEQAYRLHKDFQPYLGLKEQKQRLKLSADALVAKLRDKQPITDEERKTLKLLQGDDDQDAVLDPVDLDRAGFTAVYQASHPGYSAETANDAYRGKVGERVKAGRLTWTQAKGKLDAEGAKALLRSAFRWDEGERRRSGIDSDPEYALAAETIKRNEAMKQLWLDHAQVPAEHHIAVTGLVKLPGGSYTRLPLDPGSGRLEEMPDSTYNVVGTWQRTGGSMMQSVPLHDLDLTPAGVESEKNLHAEHLRRVAQAEEAAFNQREQSFAQLGLPDHLRDFAGQWAEDDFGGREPASMTVEERRSRAGSPFTVVRLDGGHDLGTKRELERRGWTYDSKYRNWTPGRVNGRFRPHFESIEEAQSLAKNHREKKDWLAKLRQHAGGMQKSRLPLADQGPMFGVLAAHAALALRREGHGAPLPATLVRAQAEWT